MTATPTAAATRTAHHQRTTPHADFQVTVRASGDPGQSTVEAWLVVHGLDPAARCLVVADGFDDSFHFGDRPIRCLFSPNQPGRWQALPGRWRWAVSSWRGPDDGAPAAAEWMATRFMGIRVRTRVLAAGAPD